MASLVQYLALIAVLCLGWHVLSLVITTWSSSRPVAPWAWKAQAATPRSPRKTGSTPKWNFWALD